MRIILAILLLSACAKAPETVEESIVAPGYDKAYCAAHPLSVTCPNPYGGVR